MPQARMQDIFRSINTTYPHQQNHQRYEKSVHIHDLFAQKTDRRKLFLPVKVPWKKNVCQG